MAPPTQASQTDGLMKVRVVDYALNQPVQGATVALGTGPDAPISDTSDANGNVSFAALTPNPATGTKATYTLAVTATGYQTAARRRAAGTGGQHGIWLPARCSRPTSTSTSR